MSSAIAAVRGALFDMDLGVTRVTPPATQLVAYLHETGDAAGVLRLLSSGKPQPNKLMDVYDQMKDHEGFDVDAFVPLFLHHSSWIARRGDDRLCLAFQRYLERTKESPTMLDKGHGLSRTVKESWARSSSFTLRQFIAISASDTEPDLVELLSHDADPSIRGYVAGRVSPQRAVELVKDRNQHVVRNAVANLFRRGDPDLWSQALAQFKGKLPERVHSALRWEQYNNLQRKRDDWLNSRLQAASEAWVAIDRPLVP